MTPATAATLIATVTELAVNKLFFTFFAAATLAGCGSDYDGSSHSSGTSYADSDDREPFDGDAAREQAEQEVADEGYSGPCTIDCSGHDAGFNYAANGNPDGGVSDSQSFDEGQEAYEEAVDERVEELSQAHDAGGEE